jgi:hypothetical protein
MTTKLTVTVSVVNEMEKMANMALAKCSPLQQMVVGSKSSVAVCVNTSYVQSTNITMINIVKC